MARGKIHKIFLLAFAVAVITAAVCAGLKIPKSLNHSESFNYAPPTSPALTSYYAQCEGIISPLGIGEWETSTAYSELYNFQEKQYLDKDCIYFGLPTASDTYSMEGSITSPELFLNPYHDIYILNFDYFTLAGKELANRIQISIDNGNGNFYNAGGENRVYNSNENNFVNLNCEIPSNTKRIKITVKAYYDNGAEKGVYLTDFKLSPKTLSEYDVPNFNTEFSYTEPLKYNGTRLIPSYTISADIESYPYCIQEFVLDSNSKQSDSVEIGSYTLVLIIYSADGEILSIEEKPYSIGKGMIFDVMVDYCATIESIHINDIKALDGNGRIIESNIGEITYTLQETSPYSIKVLITESDKYTSFDSGDKDLEINSQYLYQSGTYIQKFVYDKMPKEVHFINQTLLKSKIEYYQNDALLDGIPVNAGTYKAKCFINDILVKEKTIIIYPREITQITFEGGALASRPYDGTVNVYDYSATDFTFAGMISGDDTIELYNLEFASKIGRTYLVFDNVNLGNNYMLQKGAVTPKVYADITQTSIKILDNTDNLNNKILTISEKQYDGTNEAQINTVDIAIRYGTIYNAPLKFYGVPENDFLYCDSLSAEFNEVFAGENIPISLKITDLACFDRFLPEIYVGNNAVNGKIITKKLDINTSLSSISVKTKTYDGTLNASLNIDNVVFSGDIPENDLSIMNDNNNFILSYEDANYTNADAGIGKNVNVNNITLNCTNKKYEKTISSYEINDFILTGEIEKAIITIKDSYRYVVKGGEIAPLETDPENIQIYNAVYDTEEHARAGGGEGLINGFDTSIYTGIYYMRAEEAASEINHTVKDGEYDYKIIILEIEPSKKSQSISFGIDVEFEHNDGEGIYYLMAIGGKFKPSAYSYSGAYKTNLPITYELSQTGALMTYAQGIYTARNQGNVTINATCGGDNNYEPALPITIRIKIVSKTLIGETVFSDTVYYGDPLPDINGSVFYSGEEISGKYENKGGILLSGSNDYLYNFRPDNTYLGMYHDIAITLTASKAELQIDIKDIEKQYYEDIDFLDFASITLKKGAYLKILSVTEFLNLDITLNLTSLVPFRNWENGSYTIGCDDSYDSYLSAAQNENFEIIFVRSEFTVNVIKSNITIKINDFSRYYGQGLPSESEILHNCAIEGSVDAGDIELLLNSLFTTNMVRKESKIGRYNILLNQSSLDESLQNKYTIKLISGFVDIIKTPIIIKANNVNATYGEEIHNGGFTVEGFYLKDDENYFLQFITTNVEITQFSDIGTYTILVEMLQESELYDFTLISAIYTINPGILSGIMFESKDFIYDGLTHSLSVIYDKGIWGELEIYYSANDISEIGRYLINAVIVKKNYETLTLTATLIIKSLSITTSSSTNSAEIILIDEGAKGFDPGATLILAQKNDKESLALYETHLVINDNSIESILGVYNYYLRVNGARQEIEGNATIKLKIEGINSDTKLRILAENNGEMVELKYTYQNGFIIFNNNGFTQFCIIKTSSAFTKDTSSLIIGIGIAMAMAFISYLIFLGNAKNERRRRKRSKRNHKRWA